ncbi:hypothetical protein EDD18DRAFT_1113501 [Armillaria luteobubalina]|uniref:Uncharacterized protein n=1 Tax=Armillaria luteobubalina TaxID=153913 RepID=A0AA39PAE4_9AGAR|nr:hypothetical protein EDD18DRAFT_1113501 [Armillaria luteobubalina]
MTFGECQGRITGILQYVTDGSRSSISLVDFSLRPPRQQLLNRPKDKLGGLLDIYITLRHGGTMRQLLQKREGSTLQRWEPGTGVDCRGGSDESVQREGRIMRARIVNVGLKSARSNAFGRTSLGTRRRYRQRNPIWDVGRNLRKEERARRTRKGKSACGRASMRRDVDETELLSTRADGSREESGPCGDGLTENLKERAAVKRAQKGGYRRDGQTDKRSRVDIRVAVRGTGALFKETARVVDSHSTGREDFERDVDGALPFEFHPPPMPPPSLLQHTILREYDVVRPINH